jgi:hypothetical protein
LATPADFGETLTAGFVGVATTTAATHA